MHIQKYLITLLLLAVGSTTMWAHLPPHRAKQRPSKDNGVNYREICANSEAQADQEINNVRARLLAGGDCWWDLSDGRYIVPKVAIGSGLPEVSSIFAGSVWLGGIDPGGNLKLACQDYRNGTNPENDFWPGPLNELGTTERAICKNWDQHFRVTGTDIDRHLTNLREGNFNVFDIPRSIRGWPSKGNPYFVDVWGFDLPSTPQGLAGFYDADDDQLYNPLKGDYPSIEIRGCESDRYPDEMLFWIYNDQGGGAPHTVTNGRTIQMEVQVQAFAYKTNDALNDMTFQRYKLINRATESIDSTFFAMWIDADLGCAFDDYIGCDTTVLPSKKHPSGKEPRNLMYIYNQDNQDGQTGCNCSGTPTYCTKIPILGVDYFRGPLDEDGNELGMSSFMYYNNGGSQPPPPPGTTDPNQDIQYYRYITGTWADGAPLTFGGSGKGGTINTKFAFPSEPNDATGWSMQNANLPPADRRTLQASGPFRLDPGATNELIIGIPWVADQQYPAPDMEPLFRADQLAQGLFDNCFDLLDGPDAPTVNWIELDKEVVAVLSNKPKESNNENEGYFEEDPIAPASLPLAQRLYRFEGYIVYQLLDNNVSTSDYTDRDKARIVAIVDVKNKVSKLYNWKEVRNPGNNKIIYYPEEQIAAEDKGIRHTFSIKEDEFAQGVSNGLINHKRYYYSVVAYAYNNYQNFDPVNNTGQQRTYLEGRKNIQTYTVIPRPVVDYSLQAAYGEGPAITRLEGVGTGLNNFLDLQDASRDALLQPGVKDTILTYKPGRGPISVSIFNPFEVKDGEFELRIVDNDVNDTRIGAEARWELRRLPDGAVIASERTIAEINEQVVTQYGFSVLVAQAQEAGERADETNGFIGSEITYKDANRKWLGHYQDTDFPPYNYIRTSRLERDEILDPSSAVSAFGKEALFVPYVMADWILRALPGGGDRMITPAWTEGTGNAQGNLNTSANNAGVSPDGGAVTTGDRRRDRLAALPNVDIILTSDKSKWSRCVVVETASLYYTNGMETIDPLNVPKDPTLQTERGANNRPRLMFDTRPGLSVGKEDSNGDGLPDPDGAVAPVGAPDAGQPMRGMGWFPGYAIDVETGQRLNIFFGENSAYTKTLNSKFTGRDMLWNPTSQDTTDRGLQTDYYDYICGGQHWVYVSNTIYDECEQLRRRLTPELNTAPSSAKASQIRTLAWTAMLKAAPGFRMASLREGLIPNDVTIKLRTGSKYNTWWNEAVTPARKNGHPVYRFKIEGKERKDLTTEQIANSLDSIKAVPNPYYGFSQYEVSQFSNLVKITNLPGVCTVTIYSLDGKFIRQYVRNEVYSSYKQISPAVEWDLKNNKGISVASGVYLIHVSAPGLGERTLKWMGVARQFDPSGL